MMYNNNLVPKWMKKGKKYQAVNGTKIKFGGANPDHFQILFIIPHYPIHISFVVRPDDIELHLTHQPNYKHERSEHEQVFRVKNEQIKQRVENLRKQKGAIEPYRPQKWWKQYPHNVINVDMHELTYYQSSPFHVDLKFLKQNKLSKDDIHKIRFTFGYVYDTEGYCKGLLCGDEAHNRVIFVREVFLKQIVDELVNLHTLAPEIMTKIEQFGKKLIKDGMWNNQSITPSKHHPTTKLPWASRQVPKQSHRSRSKRRFRHQYRVGNSQETSVHD